MCTVRFLSCFNVTDNLAFIWTPDTLHLRLLWLTLLGLSCVYCLGFVISIGELDSSKMDSHRRPLMSQRIRCINCNICVNTCNTLRSHQVLQQDTRVISLISNWISPVIVTEEDYICGACFDLAMRSVNDQLVAQNERDQHAGPSHRGHTQVCVICGRSLANRQSHHIMSENTPSHDQAVVLIMENRIAPRQISQSDRSCHACWMSARREVTRNQQADEQRSIRPEASHQPPISEPASPQSVNSPALVDEPGDQRGDLNLSSNIILPNFRRAPNTASHCIFYGCENLTRLQTISDMLRNTLFETYKYYVPVHARVCTDHLVRNTWDSLYDAPNSMNLFTADQIEHIFLNLKPVKPVLDFSSMQAIEQLDEHLCVYWLGLTKDSFIRLLQDLPRLMEMHKGILGLAATLMKMRTGDSDARLSTLLEVPRTTLERIMGKTRDILLQDFVPRNLGIEHISREDLLENNLLIPNGIYNENNSNVITICDGTYIFLNKSSNYMFQKETYSLHKYRNLLKPFLMVSCNGYIIDCFGPYKATTSDADIMNSLFHNDSPLRQYFHPNDIFILDRGFRNSINFLQSCSYRAYIPESLLPGEHQLTTQQANRSRCVTICRWVVEVVNGYFKRDYRLFRFDHFNKSVPHMMELFKIAAGLINKFGVRLRDRVDAEQILSVLRERMPLENNLSRVVNDLNLNRRASLFISMTANENIFFPRLEYNDLILFALGTYQIRLARSYYGEHIRTQGEYVIQISRETIDVVENNLRGSGENTLVRGKIKSRHVGRKQYFVYILIENNRNGREGITEYCCSCLVGRRTVGCCAHIMSIVWYLGWARHQNSIVPPATFLDDVIIREDVE